MQKPNIQTNYLNIELKFRSYSAFDLRCMIGLFETHVLAREDKNKSFIFISTEEGHSYQLL